MSNLSVRSTLSKCLNQSASISLLEDVFSIDGIPSPNSLKSALQFIQDFRCPPAAPANLRINEVGEDSISIAWDDNADNEDGFEVRWTGRRPVSQPDDGSRNLNAPNRESFVLTGLFPNYEYCFRVRAFNAGGNSNYSNEECAIIPDSPQPEPAQGFSEVHFFNCHTDRRAVNIWRRDVTAGSSWEELDSPLSSHWQGTTCPGNNSPYVVSLPEEHAYEIVAVDTGAINCGSNNPQIISCRRYARFFTGDPNGSPTTPQEIS